MRHHTEKECERWKGERESGKDFFILKKKKKLEFVK